MAPAADDRTKEAAVKASLNVPIRQRRKARQEDDHELKSFKSLPDFLQDNEFITGHYRANLPVRQTFRTLFKLHNETGNIWTHLIGFFVFVGLTVFIACAPPTPLAFGKQQIDTLWLSVRDNVQQLTEGLHSLQHSLPSLQLPRLQSIHDNLHIFQETLHPKADITVTESAHSLKENLHQLQDNLHHKVQSLQEQLLPHEQENSSAAFEQLQQNMQAVSDNVDSQLNSTLSGVFSWPVPRWPVFVYMAGAMICLLCSATCHLYGCCSKHITQMIWRFDYSGIAILIVASFYPPVFYGFMCSPFWRWFYLITTTVMGVGTVVVSLFEVFQAPEWRTFRASMFAGLGLWGIVPIVHGWFIHHKIWAVEQAMLYDLLMGLCYLGGASIYAQRIPERWKPGYFNILFHSHQIFHVLIVVAALVHFKAVMLLLNWRDASGGCAVPVTSGPLSRVFAEMQEMGHDLFGVDQVWDKLRTYAVEHLGLAEVLGSCGV